MYYEEDFDEFLLSNTPRAPTYPTQPASLDLGKVNSVVHELSVGSSDSHVMIPASQPVIFSFAQKRSSGIPVASDALDFRLDSQNQTDDMEERSAWTQNPALPSVMDSEHVQLEPFAVMRDISKTSSRKSLDVPSLKNFLKRTSALLDDMLSEDVHAEQISHSVRMDNNSVIVVEEQFKHDFLFSDCQTENAVAISEGIDTSLFLLCHSISSPNEGRFSNSTVRGFVSGWRPNNVNDPFFLVPTFEVPTCSTALRIVKEDITVVGHRDGSLSCHDAVHARRPVTKKSLLLDGSEESIAGNSTAGTRDTEVDSFYSCAVMDDNHKESVVDVRILNKQDSTTSSMPPEVVSVDKTGVVIIWNIISKSATGTSDSHVGATPNCRFILVRLRRLASRSTPGIPCGILNDPINSSCFFLAYYTGQLVRLHREGLDVTQASPDHISSGRVMSSKCFAFSRSRPELYLVGLSDGTITLRERKKKHTVSTWSSSSKKAIVSMSWSDEDPAIITTVDHEGAITSWTLDGSAVAQGSSSSPKTLQKNDHANGLVLATHCGSYVLLDGAGSQPPLMITLNEKALIPR